MTEETKERGNEEKVFQDCLVDMEKMLQMGPDGWDKRDSDSHFPNKPDDHWDLWIKNLGGDTEQLKRLMGELTDRLINHKDEKIRKSAYGLLLAGMGKLLIEARKKFGQTQEEFMNE